MLLTLSYNFHIFLCIYIIVSLNFLKIKTLICMYVCVYIQDVAVIGRPDEAAGELPMAFVVKRPGSTVTEDDVVRFVQEKVSRIKRLRGGVQFIEVVPKNASGKILRRVLKGDISARP